MPPVTTARACGTGCVLPSTPWPACVRHEPRPEHREAEVFPNLAEVLSARLLASSVGLHLVRADLELVRDKAGGGSRSCAQIARNEAEVAKCTKLKREPQAVYCPPPDGDEVPVDTRQRECSDQVIARDFLGKAGQPRQLSL